MRALRLAVLAVLALLTSPVGAALPQLALSCSSVPAGQPSACSITRLSGGQGVYVTLQTSDGTAKAGTDYAATKQMVYLKGSVTSASVAIPTYVNQNATGTLTFNASITAGAAVVRATGSIIEPAPIPLPAPTPTPTPIPTPTPSGAWVAAPLTIGGYACSSISGSGNVPVCGQGIIYRITGSAMSSDAVPVMQYTAVFFQDASGQFPVNDAYAVGFVGYWQASDLIGIAPAP